MNPLKADTLLLLLGVCVAIITAWFAGAIGIWVIGVAAIIFTVVMLGVLFFRQMEFSRKIDRLERGLVDYEASVGERLEKMGADRVSQSDIEALKRELQLDRVKTTLASSGKAVVDPQGSEDDEDKVVPFLRIVRDEKAGKSGEQKPAAKLRTSEKAALTLYLQPIVSLQKRQTQAFEIVPGCLEEDGSFVSLSDNQKVFKRNVSAARRDLILLEQTFDLLRSLDLEDTDVKFNLPVSGGAIESKKLFKEFMRLLNLHDRFGGTLYLEIEQNAFETLNKAAQSRVVEAIDAGFGVIVGNCYSCSGALLAVSENRASGVSMNVTMLTEQKQAAGGNPELDLISQAAQSGVPLIVKNVAIEAQVMELLDYSIELAAGPYFSEPKAPKTGLRGTEPAQA